MRASILTEQQKNILDADTKHVSWLIKVDIGNTGSIDYYWSTKKKTWDGHDYTFKIKDFTPLEVSIGNPYLGILPSSKVTFIIPNEDNTLLASDFKGAAIIVTLVGKADLAIRGGADDIEFDSSSSGIIPDDSDEQEAELISFGFKVKAASSVDQVMRLECVDWFQEYVEGDYPNTPYVADLWPADIMKEDNYCVPIVFGTAYFPLRWITSGGNDYYLLGSNTPTYTINRLRSSKEVNSKTEYLSSTYTFTQSALAGSDGNNYKIVQAIINDSDKDGTNDANGFWGILGKEVYDVPFKFSRSDLSSMTNPANIVEYLLEAWGVPSGKIDDTAKAAATAIFTARGFSLNIALWAPMSRKKLLCKILAISGMVLIIREKIYMKVLTTDSQLTIESGLVARGTFQVKPMLFTHAKKDSGYVFWQKSTEPLGQGYGNKNKIAAKSATSNPSNTTIECEWVNDDTGVKQQKAGKLALQRIILPDKKVNFRAKLKFGLVESGDMITVNPDDWDTDGTPYKVQIDKEIYYCNFIGIGVECTRFSDDPDDWDDLSESSITIATADNSNAYSPIYQGPRDAKTPDSGSKANEISKTVLIGTDGILATNDDPATNGGFKATNTSLECYNSAGLAFIDFDFSTGAEYAAFGDYDNNKGMKWDQSAGTFNVKGTMTIDGSSTINGLAASSVSGWAHGSDSTKIDGGDIYTGTVTATQISANTITASEINGSGFGTLTISSGTIEITTAEGLELSGSGSFLVNDGNDIILTSSDTDPGVIQLKGSSYTTEIGSYAASGNHFMIKPLTDSVVNFYLGSATNRFSNMYLQAESSISIAAFDDVDNVSLIYCYSTSSIEYVNIDLEYDGTVRRITAYHDSSNLFFGPSVDHKTWDLARETTAFDDGWADDWNNIADFYQLDSLDDVGIINSIKGSGKIDPRSGLELIDDNTLPEFILAKDKKTGEILRDPDGKPYIPLKAGISLSWGAIRQLIKKIEELERKIK